MDPADAASARAGELVRGESELLNWTVRESGRRWARSSSERNLKRAGNLAESLGVFARGPGSARSRNQSGAFGLVG
jgi:hypothetical protein